MPFDKRRNRATGGSLAPRRMSATSLLILSLGSSLFVAIVCAPVHKFGLPSYLHNEWALGVNWPARIAGSTSQPPFQIPMWQQPYLANDYSLYLAPRLRSLGHVCTAQSTPWS